MKKICEGKISKDEVVSTTIEMYRHAFQAAENQSQVLLDSMTKYMQAEPIAQVVFII